MKEEYIKYLEYIYNNIGDCKLISSFSCLGKTYVGNNEHFAFELEKSYKNWFPKSYESILWVKESEYLEDVLKEKI